MQFQKYELEIKQQINSLVQQQKELEQDLEERKQETLEQIRRDYPLLYVIEMNLEAKEYYTSFKKLFGCFSSRVLAEEYLEPCSSEHHLITLDVVVKKSSEMSDETIIKMNQKPNYYKFLK